MRTIWSFPLVMQHTPQTILVPKGAIFLTLQLIHQPPEPHIWFEVETKFMREERTFRFIATGAPIPETCKMHFGSILWWNTIMHLYEEPRKDASVAAAVDNVFPIMGAAA